MEDELSKIHRSLHVTATSHYITSDYYGKLNVKCQYSSYVTGVLGSTGSVLSKVAWKTMAGKYPRLAPIFAASSATMSLFTVLANIPHVPTLPSTLHQLHFRSGVECQYLENKVRLFAKTDVWNPSVPWNTAGVKVREFTQGKERGEQQDSVSGMGLSCGLGENR